MLLLNEKEMKILDATAINEYKVPSLILMEYAAKSACDYIFDNHNNKEKILILSGTGNNGADGLCLARLLKHFNFEPVVFLLGSSKKLSSEGIVHYESLKALNIETYEITEENNNIEILDTKLKHSDLIIDSIFGISLNREITGFRKKAIELVNNIKENKNTKIIALDMPSGIEANTGNVLGAAIKADTTITFAHAKLGLYLRDGIEHAGKIIVSDIRIPKVAEEKLENPIKVIDKESFRNLKERPAISHKGDFGKLLIVAGSKDMGGAALLSAKAALRAGAGLVYVITHQDNKAALLSFVPEAIVHTYNDEWNEASLNALFKRVAKGVSACLVGCGLSQTSTAIALVKSAMQVKIPLLIDADGLNIMAKNKDIFNLALARKDKTILTPHIAEFARLSSKKISEIEDDLINSAKDFVKQHKLNLCLKSHRTIVCFENTNTYLNIYGNNGMATAGSGDVLSGIIAANIAQRYNDNFEESVLKAVYLHSKAGDKAKDSHNAERLIASDIIEYL